MKPENGDVVYEYPNPRIPQRTVVDSVGPPYILSFSVMASPTSPSTGVLFAGIDSKLHVSNLTFEVKGQLYSLGYTLPATKFTHIAVHATRGFTYAVLDGDEAQKCFWTTTMDIWGDYMETANISFAAPAREIGGDGFGGVIRDIRLQITH